MTWTLKFAAMACAAVLATGTAFAQAGPPSGSGAPASPGYTGENYAVRNPGDTAARDALAARDKAIEEAHRRDQIARASRAVPARPEEVTAGSEIRDKKGTLIGTIETVSMAAAVVLSPGGRVEVPLEAFGKNSRGLLIGMTKAEFDAAVAAAVKPGG